MSDELSPEFLAFSEMLDQEEALDASNLGDNGILLLELREQLRQDASVGGSLPADFSSSTALAVSQRYRAQSPLMKGLLRGEAVLRAPVFSLRGLGLSAVSLFLFALAAGLLDLELLALGGVFLLLGAGLLRGLYAWKLPASFDTSSLRWETPELRISGLYYLLPLLAVAFSASFVGRQVAQLDQVSLSFRASAGILPLLGTATTVVTFLWLINAFMPLWRAAEQRSWAAQVVVWGHGALLGLLAVAYFESNSVDVSRLGTGALDSVEQTALGILAITFLVACVVLTKAHPSSTLPWFRAVRRSIAGLLVGFVPFFLVGVIVLNFGLKQEFRQEKRYQQMVREVEAYLAEQRAVSPQEKGMTELKPFFLKSRQDLASAPDRTKVRQAMVVSQRLKGGERLWGGHDQPVHDKHEFKLISADFLRELPRIEEAVKKPYFTLLDEDEFGIQGEIPNFMLGRAVTRGLVGLADEALNRGDGTQALEYVKTNLRWSSKVSVGILLGQLISVHQLSIAYQNVERLVFEGGLDSTQLVELQKVLGSTAVKRNTLKNAMLRDIYMMDRFLLSIVEKRIDGGDWASFVTGDVGWAFLYKLLPSAYWEAERVAYLNINLDQWNSWEDLGNLANSEAYEALTMNLIASEVTPGYGRAQAQHMVSQTRATALETVVALERYRLDRGEYPETLQALVPGYLSELPKNVIHPNRWDYKPVLDYRQSGEKYELVSESPLYLWIGLAERQVYGPDGDYAETKVQGKRKG